MSRLSPNGSRCPIAVYPDLSEEDRVTYRRWSRAWYAGCAILLVGLIAIGLSAPAPNSQASVQTPAAGNGQTHDVQVSRARLDAVR